MAMGAYVVKNSASVPETVVVASGSELSLALEALDIVRQKGTCDDVRLVSMPSRELFLAQPEPVREALIPKGARVVTAEAGIAMGWEAIASTREDILSIDRFGESGPGDEVAKDLGLTPERLALMIRG
jgi:transketolase